VGWRSTVSGGSWVCPRSSVATSADAIPTFEAEIARSISATTVSLLSQATRASAQTNLMGLFSLQTATAPRGSEYASSGPAGTLVPNGGR